MRFSKSELDLLRLFALGVLRASELALALKKDLSQVYRLIKSLEKKGFLKLQNKKLSASDKTHVNILLQELARIDSFIEDISGSGLKLYTSILDDFKSPLQISKETGIKQSTLFYKLRLAKRKSLIFNKNGTYLFNYKIWPDLKNFLVELQEHEKNFDKRVPQGSIIYYKDDDEIIFSYKSNFNATSTSFSVFSEFGIKIYITSNFYCLPKREITKKDVLLHTLCVCEKEKSIQNKILLSLFYLKYKHLFSKNHHEIIENINKVLLGNKIEGYPLRSEIEARAEMYGIKI